MHDAPEERPGHLQPVEQGAEILAQAHGETGVPAMAERHQQTRHAAPGAGGRIGPQPEHAEVDLGGFPGRRVGHPDGDRRRPEAAGGLGEAVERAVGDRHALGSEPPIDLGQPEALGQPRLDLGLMGAQDRLGRAGAAPHRPLELRQHRGDLVVRGRRTPGVQATRPPGGDILRHRLPVEAGPPGDRPESVSTDIPSQHFPDLDHGQLAIGHGASLAEGAP